MRISDWSSDVCSSDLSLNEAGHAYSDIAAARHQFGGRYADLLIIALRFDKRRSDPADAILAHAGQTRVHEHRRAVEETVLIIRSEERRVGKECVSTSRTRVSRAP